MASITRQTPTSSPTHEDRLTWQVTFSEDVTGVDAADFTVTGTTATLAVTGSGTTYSVTASGGNLAALDATVTLAFASGQDIEDAAGNDLTATTPTGTNDADYVVDNTAPTVDITGVPNPSNAPFTATFTFSEAVTGFVLSDITLGNATSSNFTDTNAPVYTALITPTADGAVTVDVAADVAEDLAGNGNTAATQASSTYTEPDTIAPTVASITRQTPTSSPTHEDRLTWQVTFSEDVTGVDAADFTVTGTTATLAVTGSGTTYSVTASGGNLAGLNATVTLSFATGQNIEDAEGNPLTATTPTGTNDDDYVVDNTAPTVDITGVPNPSNAPFTATFTFSEAVTGFVLSDITLGNATSSNFTDTNAPVYTALITPTTDGAVTVDVAADVAEDLAGNGNTAATQASSTYTEPDTIAPTVASITRQSPTSSPTHEDRLTWQVTFSEDVTGVDAADFEVTGTTATLAVTGSGTTYSVTASGGNLAGLNATVTLSFATGQNIQDAEGNPLTATTPTGTNDDDYVVDNTAPTVDITGVPNPSNAPFTATFTFSEAVTGFVLSDITLGNATSSNFTDTNAPVYTALITPTADGAVTVDVAADVAEDLAGNGNTVATQASSTYTAPDTTAPTVASITRQTPTSSPTHEDRLTWQVTFSEDVTGVDAADFTVTGTSATLAVTGSGTTYSVTASGGNLAGLNATVTLSFATGQNIQDAEGNPLTATPPTGTNNNDYVVDNTAPTVEITGVPLTSSAPFTATFTFSEAVTGFVLSDITLGNATSSNFTDTNAPVYTALITPTADGAVTVDVAADVAEDLAGNGNTAATQASSTYTEPDTTAPTVASITRQTPTSSPTREDSLTWEVTFSEDVTGVDAADFTVTGTSATPAVTGSGTTYSVTASGGNLAGLNATVTLSFATGQNIQDAEGNPLTATTPTGTNDDDYVVDNTAPTVDITGVPNPSNAPFTATFTFSEAVTGFVLSDITLGNATSSTFTDTNAPVYTALITPTADGAVTVDVAADVAEDLAGNGNTAATQASSTYTEPDTIAPTVASITRQTPTSSPTHEDRLTWQVTFSEDVTGVDAADFTVTGTTATLAVTGSGTTYSVTASGGNLAGLNATVTLSFATGQNIQDAEGNPLTATTPTGTNDDDYVVDNTAPTVDITGVPNPSNAPFTATFTFSEAVTGFVLSDITLGNATSSNFTDTNAPVYTALITPAADGAVTVDVAADVAEDLAGNGNTAATQASSTYTEPDTIAPTVASITRQTPTSSPTHEDRLTWQVTFSEAVTGVDAADFTVTGTSATLAVTGSGTTYSVTASGGNLAGLNATVTLSFATGQNIEDAEGNPLTATTPTGTNDDDYVVDNTAPTVDITGVPNPSNAPFTATFTFSEAVTGFVLSDITLGNATSSNFTDTNAPVYTALITPTTDGAVTVDVAADVAEDLAGNGNTAATQASSTYTEPDTIAPTVASITRQTPTSSPTHEDRLTWQVTFSEAVTGVDAADFEVTGTTATPAVTGSGTTYSVTASGGNLAGLNATVTLSFATGQNIEDAEGNPLTATTPTGTNDDDYVVDNTAPTVDITGVPNPSNAPFTATFTFSEAVTGFVLSDITLGNATSSNFTDTNAPVYTALITPTADGAVTVDVAADVAEDLAGNGNTVATQASSTYTAPDTTAPTVASITRQTPTSSPTHEDRLTWQVTFSEDVTGVDAADFTVTGTSATLAVTGSGTTYSVTASGGNLAGLNATVTLSFATGQNIQDAEGNPLTATPPTGTNNNDYVVDNTAPTVEITGVPLTSSAPFTATFTFSEAVTGFVLSDITLGNATSSNFTDTNAPVYTALITPTADGAVTVDVAADVAEDLAGNGNTAATQASSTYTEPDTTAPTVASITRQTPTSSPTREDSLTWEVTFSEDVTGVDAADFTVTGTSATPAVTGSGTTYSVTASGGNLAGLNATVTLSFATGQNIQDAEGNPLTATTPTGTNDDDYVVDNTAPTVDITGVPNPSNAPFTATFTFSEAVTGFVLSDITLGNATSSTFTDTNAPVYTALITPTADGAVTVDVAADVAEDLAGNGNTAATQASSTYTEPDTIAPTVASITRQTPTSSPTHEDRLTWQVTFSEDVTGVDAADFTVTGTTATLAVTGSGTTYSVTASGGNLAGLNATVTLSFATGQNIQDAEGNPLTATTPTGTNDDDYVVDNTAPTVDITGVPNPSNAPFTATFTFSEAVTGFVLSDITLGNATSSNFTDTNAPVYTALITPAADGAVTVDVAADVAEDLAGNGNTAATQASSTYTEPDTIAPTVASITRQTPTSSPTHEDRLTWQVTFSEAVTGVDAADFTVTGTSATLAVTGSGTTYSVTASGGNLAGLNATVTLSFATGQNIQDAEGNPLTATTPTGTNNNDYVVDNAAPTVTSIERRNPSSSPTSEDSLTWRVTLDEAVTGVDAADFEVSGTTATLTVTGSGTTYDVTASGGNLAELDATVTLAFASGQDIEDAAGNALSATTPTGTNDDDYVVGNTAPRATSGAVAVTVTGEAPVAREGQPFTLTVTRAGLLDTDLFLILFVHDTEGVTGGGIGRARAVFLRSGEASATLTVTPGDDGDLLLDRALRVSAAFSDPEESRFVLTSPTYQHFPVLDAVARQAPVLSAQSLHLAEGERRSYTVALGEAPTDPVTLRVTGAPAWLALTDGNGADLTASGAGLTFTAANWQVAQTVRVDALEDDDAADGEAALLHLAMGPSYVSELATLAVTVDDDETAALVLSKSALPVVEQEPAVSFTVKLASAPSAPVTVTVPVPADSDLTVTGTMLTFDASNWDVAQTVTVAARHDADAAPDPETLTLTPAGAAEYAALAASAVTVTVADDDVPGIRPSVTALDVAEGASAGFEVRLNTKPSGTVEVRVTGVSGTDLTVTGPGSVDLGAGGVLTFTPTDWETDQTVTVAADKDDDAADDRATLTLGASGADYGSAPSREVTVTVDDDGTPALEVADVPVTVQEQGPGVEFQVRLKAEPVAPVTVRVSGYAGTDVRVTPSERRFTADNWEAFQTFSVRAVDDTDAVTDPVVTLMLEAPEGSAEYAALTAVRGRV